MSWFKTIRARLVLWYFTSVVLLLAFLSAGSWYATKKSIYQAIDKGLMYRMDGVIELLGRYATYDRTLLANRLDESSSMMEGGGLFRVFDDQLHLVYQSPALPRHQTNVGPPQITESEVAFRNIENSRWKLRSAARRVKVGDHQWVVEVAEPLMVYESALREYQAIVLMSLPFLAILAGFAGNYISGRALKPVDRITTSARTITANNLSERLSVSDTGDELHRLSETLNSMLDRIESSFNTNRQFTADASHELRAPLTLIQSAAEYALRRDRDRSQLQDALRQILRESRRTVEMLNNLLMLARSDANAKSLEAIVVDLKSVLEDLRPSVEALADTTGQSISFDVPSDAIEVKGNDTSLRQLVLSLIDNAIKYTPPNGSVSVSLSDEDGLAVLTVRDTGIGISQDQIPYIFDRFWRADKVRSREFGGTGLGLSIARAIAEQHGATISVESVLEQGSSFTVKFPMHRESLQVTA